MATSQMSEVIQHLRRTVLLGEGAGLTDGQLLEDYISRRDEAALAALVRRHGPMVWGVCRRVLRNHHDAEDAFQATFLVLVRKAVSIASRELLANWLYGVAYRTAVKAKAMAVKRRGRERQVTEMPEPAIAEQERWHDLYPLLDEELSRLPDKYSAVIVLCDLEGKTRKEAARQLGCPEGTVGGRLARARGMLAKRLARRGVVLSGSALAAVVSQNGASGAVPASVVSSTIKAASLFAAGQAAGMISVKVAALTEGVLKTMLLKKLKVATVILLAVSVLGTGAGWLTHHALAQKPTDKVAEGKKSDGEGIALVSGVVKAVDADKNTITVADLAGKVPETTYEVSKTASVYIDGKAGKLAAVPVAAHVTLNLSGDKRTVRSIQAGGPHIAGVVLKSVDAGKNTVTVADLAGKVPETTYEVAKTASVYIDGKPGKLAGVPVDAHITLSLSVDQKTALRVDAVGPQVLGTVKAVDAAKNSLTVTNKLGDQTFDVGKDATIVVDGKPGKLADLKEGMEVDLRLTVDKKTVVSITAGG